MKRCLSKVPDQQRSVRSKKSSVLPVEDYSSLVRTEGKFREAMFEFTASGGTTWCQLLNNDATALKTVHTIFMLGIFTSSQPSPSECRIETLPETLRRSIEEVRTIKEQYKLLCVRSAMVNSLKTALSSACPALYAKAVHLILTRPVLPPLDELLPITDLPSPNLRSGVYIQLRNCTNPAYSTLALISRNMPAMLKARLFGVLEDQTITSNGTMATVVPSDLLQHFNALATRMKLLIQHNFSTSWQDYARLVHEYFVNVIFDIDPVRDGLEDLLLLEED